MKKILFSMLVCLLCTGVGTENGKNQCDGDRIFR